MTIKGTDKGIDEQAGQSWDAIFETEVLPEWVDYNGHMNVAYYVLVFDGATDAFMDRIGLDAQRRKRDGNTLFTVEGHITYKSEVHLGDRLVCDLQLLGYDEKRLRFMSRMHHKEKGYLAATMEWLHLHVDLKSRRVTPIPEDVLAKLAGILEAQTAAPWPEEAGRAITRPEGCALGQKR